jgi:transcriptional regulator with GAF, ATPase, and Fis domain
MKITVVQEGERTELAFDAPTVRVGRAPDNDVRIDSPRVSRHHCLLERDPQGVWAVDLSSSNGTLLNGAPISRARVASGDRLQVGRAVVLVEEAARPGREQDLSATRFSTRAEEDARERGSLRVFATLTRALVEQTELAPLLRSVVDAALELVGGERGFLLLRGKGRGADAANAPGGMSVRVARSFDRTDIPVPSSRLSSGIAAGVLESGRPVLSVDAGDDDRFSAMASVEEMRLRSVLCVPVVLEDREEGVLYVDNRLQRAAFSEDDLDLVELLAGFAAVAIRNARLLAELRQQNDSLAASRSQIEALNRQLGRKVRDRDTELAVVRAELERERGRHDYTSIVGASEGMRRVFDTLDRLIETELPVLIEGESGTGKELIARAVHFNGPRRGKPFVSVNCAALPDSLLESELFGHARGAFTGADRAKQGLFEQASGGTLFLDEIGDMTTEMQKKLLRVLQEGEVRPLGSNRTVSVDTRLVSASHRDLAEMVKEGSFREDLFYRVNVLSVGLPPLRERREDVPLLAEALLARAARETGREVPLLSSEALAELVDHDWPGNVRELENEMRRLVVLCDGVVEPDHLSASIRVGGGAVRDAEAPIRLDGDLPAAIARFERSAIRSALERTAGNKSKAAELLGISRFALQRKLDKYEGESEPEADG